MIWIAIGLLVSAIAGLVFGRLAVTGRGEQPTDESFKCLMVVVAFFLFSVILFAYLAVISEAYVALLN